LDKCKDIGNLIVEDEQNVNAKANYGDATLKKLGTQLTLEFGKGFDNDLKRGADDNSGYRYTFVQ